MRLLQTAEGKKGMALAIVAAGYALLAVAALGRGKPAPAKTGGFESCSAPGVPAFPWAASK